MLGYKLVKKMNNLDNFKIQFKSINNQIAQAILDEDYTKAKTLDLARQDIIQDLSIIEDKHLDNSFFEFLEECVKENADIIDDVQLKMLKNTKTQSNFVKALNNYKKI